MEALLIDDDSLLYEGMTISLAHRGIQLHTTADLPQALAFLATHKPAVIILDLVFRDPATGHRNHNQPIGLEIAKTLSQQYPAIPLLVYSNQFHHWPELRVLLEKHKAGAGYLSKGDGPTLLAEFLRSVVAGEKRYRHDALLNSDNGHAPAELQPYLPYAQEKFRTLTPREMEACQLAATGLSNPQIAEKRGVSIHTINQNFSEIYKKLGLSRADQPDGANPINSRALLIALYNYLHDSGQLPPA